MHTISDLGAVGCGVFEGRQVCSPWHVAANVSWAVTGSTIAVGAVLLWRLLARDALSRLGWRSWRSPVWERSWWA
ncbi:MAG: hypothetical protein QM604_04570 [Microbacterium sp.]